MGTQISLILIFYETHQPISLADKELYPLSYSHFLIYFALFKCARKVDVLHIMNVNIYSLISSIIFRIRNREWVIYLKMDSPLFQENDDKREKIKKIPRFIRNMLFKNINYFGFEDKILQKFYKETFPKFREKFIFTTNWFLKDPNIVWDLAKQNRIVLVWRFWSYQKNNEILMELLQNYNYKFLNDWDIYLCGWMTDKFNENLKKLKTIDIWVANHIHEMWFLNHDDLYNLMKTCKIFLHTARFEWDPNVQYDAMYTWCFMVSTDVANIKQNYPKKCSCFFKSDDVLDLYNALKYSVLKVKKYGDNDFFKIQEYWLKNFERQKSLKEILNKI